MKKKKRKKRETETHSGKTKVLNLNPAASGTTTTGQKPRKVPTSHNGMLTYPQRGHFLSSRLYVCMCLHGCIIIMSIVCACVNALLTVCVVHALGIFLSVGHSHSCRAMVTQLIWKSPSWFLTAAILTRLLSEQPWPA